MNDDQLDDLKQFIDSRISQAEARLEDQIKELGTEMRDGFAGVAEAIEQLHTADADLGERLTKLEQQPAA